MSDTLACFKCKKTDSEAHLYRCPICFKHVCSEDAFNYSGRIFCDKHCADHFFFDDEE